MIKRLLILNGIAIIAAVIHHSTHWVITAMFWWTDRYLPVTIPNYDKLGSLSYYAVRFFDQFAYSGVAIFLFVSGVFIAIVTGRDQKTTGWGIIFSRIKTLVIPYLIWSVLIIPLNLYFGAKYTGLQLVKVFLTGGATAAYYYVPLLVVFLLLSPILVPLARNRWKLLLFIATILELMVIIPRYHLLLDIPIPILLRPIYAIFIDWQIPANILWFVLGMTIGFHIPEARQSLARNKWLILIGLILTFVAGPIEWELLRRYAQKEWLATQVPLFDQLFTLFFLLAYLAWDHLSLPLSAELSKIGTQSYGIYLVHMTVLDITAKTVYHLLPGLLAHPFFFQTLLVTMGLAIPLLLMLIINRSPVRRFYRYLFG